MNLNIYRHYLVNIPIAVLVLSLAYLPSVAQSAHHAKMANPHTARLGVLLMNVPFQQLESLKLEYGVRVGRVVPNSPAEKAGLQAEDIIFEFNGKPVYSVKRLQWLIRKVEAGTKISLQYSRNGESISANAQFPVIGAHQTTQMHPSPARTVMGVAMQSITYGLREYFGVPENVGILIVEVKKGSPADTAGIKVGDVITKIEKTPIRDLSDVYRALDALDPGTKISVEFIRKNASQTVTVSPEANPMQWHHGHHEKG